MADILTIDLHVLGLKFPKMMEDLRVLLTGRREGPPVLEVIQVLGKASVARRLERYRDKS